MNFISLWIFLVSIFDITNSGDLEIEIHHHNKQKFPAFIQNKWMTEQDIKDKKYKDPAGIAIYGIHGDPAEIHAPDLDSLPAYEKLWKDLHIFKEGTSENNEWNMYLRLGDPVEIPTDLANGEFEQLGVLYVV